MSSKHVLPFLILFAVAFSAEAMTPSGKDFVSHEKDHMAAPVNGGSPSSWLRVNPGSANYKAVSLSEADCPNDSCLRGRGFRDVPAGLPEPGK